MVKKPKVPKLFLYVSPLLDVRNCCKISVYAIQRKTNKPKLEKIAKNLILDPILALLA